MPLLALGLHVDWGRSQGRRSKHKKHTYQELLRARGCPLCRPPSSFDSSFAAKHGLHLPTCPLAALHSTAAWVPAMVCSARSFAALLSSMLFHGTVKVDGLLPTLACLSGVLVVFNCSVETAAREPCRPCSSRLWRAVKDGVGLITPVWVAVSAVGGGSGVRRMRLPGPMTLHCPFCELAASMLLPVFLLDRAACQAGATHRPAQCDLPEPVGSLSQLLRLLYLADRGRITPCPGNAAFAVANHSLLSCPEAREEKQGARAPQNEARLQLGGYIELDEDMVCRKSGSQSSKAKAPIGIRPRQLLRHEAHSAMPNHMGRPTLDYDMTDGTPKSTSRIFFCCSGPCTPPLAKCVAFLLYCGTFASQSSMTPPFSCFATLLARGRGSHI